MLIAFNPGGEYCSPDLCLLELRDLARFSLEQGVQWRREVAGVMPPILLTASGNSWVGTNEAPFRIESISPAGRTNVIHSTPGVPPPFPNPNGDRLWELAGPVANRLLVQSVYGLRLIDSAGVVLAEPVRGMDSRLAGAMAADALGYLGSSTGIRTATRRAVDSCDLRLLATARVPELSPPHPRSGHPRDHMTDAAHSRCPPPTRTRGHRARSWRRSRCAHARADRITRDGFEP